MHPMIQERREDIVALCQRYHVRNLEVFGSAARGDDFDEAGSDADFLVEFEPHGDLSPLEESILRSPSDRIATESKHSDDYYH